MKCEATDWMLEGLAASVAHTPAPPGSLEEVIDTYLQRLANYEFGSNTKACMSVCPGPAWPRTWNLWILSWWSAAMEHAGRRSPAGRCSSLEEAPGASTTMHALKDDLCSTMSPKGG